MKSKSNQRNDKGITLIALIITIILLVILAAITIKAVYNMNIVGIASDAVIDYAIEQNKEINTLNDVENILKQLTGGFKVSLTVENTTSYTIEVIASVTEVKGTIESYKFDYKLEDEENWHEGEPIQSEETSYKYKYEGLKDGQKYNLRVTVKDNEGISRESNVVGQTEILVNQSPTFDGTPTVAKVANSNTSLTITAKATDPDGDNLTYTLCDSAGNAITTNVSQTANASGGVVFTHSGLGNFSTHTYTVKVTDNKITEGVQSDSCSGTTYCLGTYCRGRYFYLY